MGIQPQPVPDDLLMCEGSETVTTSVLDVEFPINRGELIADAVGPPCASPRP